MPMRVAVCISGRGSNLSALVTALPAGGPAEVVLVVSNRADAGGIAWARGRAIETHILADHADAAEWLRELARRDVGLIVLAGYLKLVPAPVIEAYRGCIINVHPALLPHFGGEGMYGRRVHAAVLARGDVESGATVHLVDEVYDRGAILAQARVPVRGGDTPESLGERVLGAEHRLLPAVVLAAARAGRPVPLAEVTESTS